MAQTKQTRKIKKIPAKRGTRIVVLNDNGDVEIFKSHTQFCERLMCSKPAGLRYRRAGKCCLGKVLLQMDFENNRRMNPEYFPDDSEFIYW